MCIKDSRRFFCLAVGLLGLILIGLGVNLLATFFPLRFITIGTIVAGILLLILCCLVKCNKIPCVFCLLLTLVSLYLIISGILAIIFIFSLIIGLILIGLGVLSVLLTAVCLILQLCGVTFYKTGSSPGC